MAKILQLLRNSTVSSNREDSKAALIKQLKTLKIGEPAVNFYNTDDSLVKALFGISYGDGTNYTIIDVDAVPSEVQDAINGLKGGTDEQINNAYNTIKKIADALVIINGAATVEGSIAKAEQDAKDYVDAQIATSLVQYVGQDAIAVSEGDEGEKTISLKLNTNDKVLTQTTDGLLANINLTWSKSDGLKLTGKGGAAIATIAATDFIKDGMLQNVELKTASSDQPVGDAQSGTFLVFTFNTDAEDKVINLNVTSLIDVYTAGDGISVTGKVIAAKLDASTESFLTVGADGIKLSGVQTAINAAKQEVQTEVDAIETAVGLGVDGSFTAPEGSNYTDEATTVMDAISKLDTQVKTNATAIEAETSRATAEETRITDTVIGEDQLEKGKSVMDVILENEEITQQAIEKLATATGVLSDEEIKYTAPTVSDEFSSTTSILDMLNKIDEKWNTIDCGTY